MEELRPCWRYSQTGGSVPRVDEPLSAHAPRGVGAPPVLPWAEKDFVLCGRAYWQTFGLATKRRATTR
jgi:hypothetical protein